PGTGGKHQSSTFGGLVRGLVYLLRLRVEQRPAHLAMARTAHRSGDKRSSTRRQNSGREVRLLCSGCDGAGLSRTLVRRNRRFGSGHSLERRASDGEDLLRAALREDG